MSEYTTGKMLKALCRLLKGNDGEIASKKQKMMEKLSPNAMYQAEYVQ